MVGAQPLAQFGFVLASGSHVLAYAAFDGALGL
jgi:hypothetical protein